MTKEEINRHIREAWGYTKYQRSRYDSFDDYMTEHLYMAPHEEGRDRYASAARSLETLVRNVYTNLTEDE